MEKHKLEIISLHDAQAKCKCGWHFSSTGARTEEEIKELYEYHLNIPKVIVQVSGGMISVVRCDKNVDLELRDYDIDTTSDKEFEDYGETVFIDENGDRYITR